MTDRTVCTCVICGHGQEIGFQERLIDGLVSKDQLPGLAEKYLTDTRMWVKTKEGLMCPICALRRDVWYFEKQCDAICENLNTPVMKDIIIHFKAMTKKTLEETEMEHFFKRMDNCDTETVQKL